MVGDVTDTFEITEPAVNQKSVRNKFDLSTCHRV